MSYNFLLVYWPTCLEPHANKGLPLETKTGSTMATCMADCGASNTCKYWTYNFDDNTCQIFDILNIGSYTIKGNVVSGPKGCQGECKNL